MDRRYYPSGYCLLPSLYQVTAIILITRLNMKLSLLHSAFLYKLAKEEATFPSVHNTEVLRTWITRINQEAGDPQLKATNKVMGTIWKRAQKVCYRVKCLRHGRQQAAFLSQDYRLTLSSADLKTAKDIRRPSNDWRVHLKRMPNYLAKTPSYPSLRPN